MRLWDFFSADRPSVDDIDIDERAKADVLELVAFEMWRVWVDLGVQDGGCKSYDPMEVDLERGEAHSYVFDLDDGGRHHPFRDLRHLEQMMRSEMKRTLSRARREIWSAAADHLWSKGHPAAANSLRKAVREGGAE